MRAVLVGLVGLTLVALGGCGGSGGAPADAGLLDEAGNPVGPNDIIIAGGPPIELPGTVLWLDGNFGLARAGDQVRAWTDRSGHAHVFQAEGSEPGATTARLGNHGAIHLDGRTRLVLSPESDEDERAALTIGERDFVLAVVLADEQSESPGTAVALAGDTPALAAALSLAPGLRFQLLAPEGEHHLDTFALAPAAPHLVVVTALGAATSLRVDGQEAASHPAGRLRNQQPDAARLALPFVPVQLGGNPGLTGAVAEVVLLVGPGLEEATAALEMYLRSKYGL